MSGRTNVDVAVIGAGAAGLATAIFTRQLNPDVRVALVDGARAPGAKILVSGGSRCNVTNTVVTEADFNGARAPVIRRILRAFPVHDTVAFFKTIGVPLHEEPGGKLFPDSNHARTVLDALMTEARRAGVQLLFGRRVTNVSAGEAGFQIATSGGDIAARRVVLATGGLSLPKTGSDGAGYAFATALGHTLVPTTPALVPLLLDATADDTHRQLSGVAQPVRIDVRVNAQIRKRITGALLWTHFGVSGPAVLDASRHWLRARLEGQPVSTSLSLAPVGRFDVIEREWIESARTHQRATVHAALARMLPASVATALAHAAGVPAGGMLATLTRDERRAVLHRLLEWPLAITGSRGYNYAEVTAGGVTLSEVDPATMESRISPGLHLVGEILDVDGRIGGFNFQWAWSSARVAALGLARC